MAKQLQLLWHAFNRTLERLLPFTWISRANHYLFSNRECLSHPHNQHAQPGVVMLRRKPNQARYNDISNYAVMTRRKLFPKSKSHHPLLPPPELEPLVYTRNSINISNIRNILGCSNIYRKRAAITCRFPIAWCPNSR